MEEDNYVRKNERGFFDAVAWLSLCTTALAESFVVMPILLLIYGNNQPMEHRDNEVLLALEMLALIFLISCLYFKRKEKLPCARY